MIKSFLIAAAIMIATPEFLFSQDFFLSFDNDAVTTTAIAQPGTTGTAYIFADSAYAFDAADINFTSSDSSVLLLTGGAGIDEPFFTPGPADGGVFRTRFDSSDVTIAPPSEVSAGNWFAANTTQHGIDPASTSFDPNFVPGVGRLLAQVDYDVVDDGNATLDLTLGTQDFLAPPFVFPTLGSATIIVSAVPEPSSALLLVLGSVGLVSRRRGA